MDDARITAIAERLTDIIFDHIERSGTLIKQNVSSELRKEMILIFHQETVEKVAPPKTASGLVASWLRTANQERLLECMEAAVKRLNEQKATEPAWVRLDRRMMERFR